MIVCCGEALIDMLPRQTAAGETAFAPYVGGAVFNSDRAGATGPAGLLFHWHLLRFLWRHAARHAGGQQCRSQPGAVLRPANDLAFVRLVDGHATYLFYDENTAGRMLIEEDMPLIGDDIEAMHFSCISLIPEPCGSTYGLMRREHTKRVMMFDPNIRKNFIKDKQAHLARMMRMLEMADIVKLSDEDLEWFGETGSHAGNR